MRFLRSNKIIYAIPLAVFLIMSSLCGYSMSELYKWQVDHYYDYMEAAAHDHVAILSLALDSPFNLLESLSRDSLFRELSTNEAELTSGMEDISQNSVLEMVGFVNMAGYMLNEQGELERFLYVDTNELLSKDTRFIQRVSLEGDIYDNQFLLSVPVYDRGTRLGSLVAVYDNKEFATMFTTKKNYIQESATFCVVDIEGEIIVHDPSDRYMNITSDFFAISDTVLEESGDIVEMYTKMLSAGKSTSLPYVYDGKQYFLHIVPVELENFEENSWYLIEIVDAKLMANTMKNTNMFTHIISGIGLAICIVSCFVIYKLRRIQSEYGIIARGLKGGVRRGHLGDEGTIDYMSEGLATLFGYTHKEIVERVRNQYKEFIYHEDQALYEETMAELQKQIGSKKIEYRIHHREGALKWVSDEITTVRTINGKVYTYAVVTDIHDFKVSQNNLNAFMDSVPGGIVIFDVAHKIGRATVPFMNDATCELMGCTKEEFRARVVNQTWDIAIAEDVPNIKQKFRNMIEGSDYEECTYRTNTSTGIAWMRLTAKVIQRGEENVQVYTVIMNIDEQMRTEALLKKERYYQELIDESLSAATLITAFDEDRTLLYASKNIEKLLGYSEEEFRIIYQDKYKDLIHPMELKRIINLKHLYAEREVEHYELQFRARHKNGTYIWLVEKATLIEDIDGKQAHLIVAFDDSERKNAEQEMIIREEEFRIASLQNNKIVYRYNLVDHVLTVPDGVEDRIGFTKHQEQIPESMIATQKIHPDSIEAVRGFFQNIHAKKAKGEVEIAVIQSEGWSKWYLIRYTLVYNTVQQAISAIISAVDITEIKNIKHEYESLRESEKLAEIIALHAEKQVERYNVATKILEISKEEIKKLGLPNKEAYTIQDVLDSGTIPEEEHKIFLDFLSQIDAGARDGCTQYHVKYPDGAYRLETAMFTTVFDDDGQPEYAIISVEDSTEQCEKEANYKHYKELMLALIDEKTTFEYNVSKKEIIEVRGTHMETLDKVDKTYAGLMEYCENTYVYGDDIDGFLNFFSNIKMLYLYEQGIHSATFDFRANQKDGSYRWKCTTQQLLADPNSADVLAFITIEDIHDEKQRELDLIEKAEIDGLTKINNRATFTEKMTAMLEEKNPKELTVFAIVDLDNFKQINDTLGHRVGDQVLIDVADTLKDMFRANDLVGRLGGDEFVIYLRRIESYAHVEAKMDQLVQRLSKEYGAGLRSGASIGIARCPLDGASFDTLYEKADQAMYLVKEKGGSDYAFYQGDK